MVNLTPSGSLLRITRRSSSEGTHTPGHQEDSSSSRHTCAESTHLTVNVPSERSVAVHVPEWVKTHPHTCCSQPLPPPSSQNSFSIPPLPTLHRPAPRHTCDAVHVRRGQRLILPVSLLSIRRNLRVEHTHGTERNTAQYGTARNGVCVTQGHMRVCNAHSENRKQSSSALRQQCTRKVRRLGDTRQQLRPRRPAPPSPVLVLKLLV